MSPKSLIRSDQPPQTEFPFQTRPALKGQPSLVCQTRTWSKWPRMAIFDHFGQKIEIVLA